LDLEYTAKPGEASTYAQRKDSRSVFTKREIGLSLLIEQNGADAG
jgi:hypothetical protein